MHRKSSKRDFLVLIYSLLRKSSLGRMPLISNSFCELNLKSSEISKFLRTNIKYLFQNNTMCSPSSVSKKYTSTKNMRNTKYQGHENNSVLGLKLKYSFIDKYSFLKVTPSQLLNNRNCSTHTLNFSIIK